MAANDSPPRSAAFDQPAGGEALTNGNDLDLSSPRLHFPCAHNGVDIAIAALHQDIGAHREDHLQRI